MNTENTGGVGLRTKQSPWLLLVASCPVIATAAIYWRLVAMDRGRFAWSGDLVVIVAIVAIVAGFVGGICLIRRSAWWLVLTLLSLALGFAVVQMIAAIGLGQMH